MKPVIEFLKNHPKLTLTYISHYYPFSFSELTKYKHLLDWGAVSSNSNINFTENILLHFRKYLWTRELLKNPAVRWKRKTLAKLVKNRIITLKGNIGEEKIIEFDLNLLHNLNAKTIALIVEKNAFTWSEYVIGRFIENLSPNQIAEVRWSINTLEKFKDKFEWTYCLARDWKYWNISNLTFLIKNYPKLVDWYHLSQNENINWNDSFIDKFLNNWYWYLLANNKKLPWSIKFIRKYKKYLGAPVFNNAIKWTEHLIEMFKDEINTNNSAEYLCYNENVNWTEEAINSFCSELYLGRDREKEYSFFNDKIKLYMLKESRNDFESIFWSRFSANENFDWSISFIKKYSEELDWTILSQNGKLPWSYDLINLFKDKWNWIYLSQNPGIVWSDKMLEKFGTHLLWDRVFKHGKVKIYFVNFTIYWELIDNYFKKADDYHSGINDIEKIFSNESFPCNVQFVNFIESKMLGGNTQTNLQKTLSLIRVDYQNSQVVYLIDLKRWLKYFQINITKNSIGDLLIISRQKYSPYKTEDEFLEEISDILDEDPIDNMSREDYLADYGYKQKDINNDLRDVFDDE